MRISPVWRVTLWYLALASSWIVLSGIVVERTVDESSSPTLEMAKGLAFVGVTALLLSILTRRALRSVAAERDRAERNERLWRELFEDSPLSLMVVDPETLEVLAANDSACAMSGFRREDLLDRPVTDLHLPVDRAAVASAIRSPIDRAGAPLGRWSVVGAHGRSHWVDLAAARSTFGGRSTVTVWAGDVTGEVETAEARERTERWVQDVFASIDVVVWSLDPASRRPQFVSGSTAAVFGRVADAFLADPALRELIVHPDDGGALRELDVLVAETGWGTAEYRIVRPDGAVRWMREYERAVTEAGQVVRIDGFVRDVTTERRAREVVAAVQEHDPLTGLFNRHAFDDLVDAALRGSEDPAIAVLALDLDQFSTINEAHGATTGDRALVEVAARLQAAIGPDDVLGRVGDDEFAVLVAAAVDDEVIVARAGSIFAVFDEPFEIDGHELVISATGGVAPAEPGSSADFLLLEALAAAKRGKTTGPGGFEFGRAESHARALASVHLIADLKRGMAAGELVLHYQPEVDPVTGEVSALEALVRWDRGDHVAGPGEFLPTAERTGLMRPLGRLVIEMAARDLARWSAPPHRQPPVIWVNLSRAELGDDTLADTIDEVVERHGAAQRRLGFEVTETAFLADEGAAVATLERLHDAGHPLALDDFGTGWSSLVSLRDFPIDVVKIDRQFVSAAPTDRSSLAIVRAVVALAHGLGMTVVAEGAEQQAEVDLLASLGCDRVQGWRYAAATPLPEADRFVTEGFDPHP